MSVATSSPTQTQDPPETVSDGVLARLRGPLPGPTLVVIAGLHGNETSGLRAAERVLHDFPEDGLVRGDFLILEGNREAIRTAQRYVDRDLNRNWFPAEISSMFAGTHAPETAEDLEIKRIAEQLQAARHAARGNTYLLDLHSTSGASLPFINVGDAIPSRRLTRYFPVPAVLGLDESLAGTLLQWAEEAGWVGLVFEGGQHEADSSIDAAEAAIWIGLGDLGLVAPEVGRPAAEQARSVLARLAGGERGMFEVVARHAIEDRQLFEMNEGFASFDLIAEGEHLAEDAGEAVTASRDSWLLMPLYQPQGSDGFFLMRRFGPIRQVLSRALRRLGSDRLLPLLPGLERPNERSRRRLLVPPGWLSGPRWRLLVLLGYRRQVADIGDKVLLERRRQRMAPLASLGED